MAMKKSRNSEWAPGDGVTSNEDAVGAPIVGAQERSLFSRCRSGRRSVRRQ